MTSTFPQNAVSNSHQNVSSCPGRMSPPNLRRIFFPEVLFPTESCASHRSGNLREAFFTLTPARILLSFSPIGGTRSRAAVIFFRHSRRKMQAHTGYRITRTSMPESTVSSYMKNRYMTRSTVAK